MFLRIDQMRPHMVLEDLSHEARHGAARTGDEMHDLLAPRLFGKRAFYAVNLSSKSANARQQLFSIANRMAHPRTIAYLPTLYKARASRDPKPRGGSAVIVYDASQQPTTRTEELASELVSCQQ
jgi:hypothetical protein